MLSNSNPFSLMFGKEPESAINRDIQISEIIETFSSGHPSTMAYMITGVRGYGKTVMLSTVSRL